MHADCPWRTVVHIDDLVGPQGGCYWALTLECGHTAFRRQLRIRETDSMPRVRWHGKLSKLRTFTAPVRVKCYHCGHP